MKTSGAQLNRRRTPESFTEVERIIAAVPKHGTKAEKPGNRVSSEKNMPERIIIKRPIMTVEDYFTMIWDQLYQIHNTGSEGTKQNYTLTWS